MTERPGAPTASRCPLMAELMSLVARMPPEDRDRLLEALADLLDNGGELRDVLRRHGFPA